MREIADAAFAYQRAIDAEQKIIVGVNAYQEQDEPPLDLLTVDEAVEAEQIAALQEIKQYRSADDVARTLDEIRRVAAAGGNVLPPLLEAARARVTVGEAMHALADVYGRFRPGDMW